MGKLSVCVDFLTGKKEAAAMNVKTALTKRIRLSALTIFCALFAAATIMLCAQKAEAVTYEPVTSTYDVVDTYEPRLANDGVLKATGVSSVSITANCEWGSAAMVPDSVQIWRTDPDDTSETRTVCLASVDPQESLQAQFNITEDQVIPGKANYMYAVVAVKESAGELSLCSRWSDVGGLSYAASGIRATKISANKVWVYVDMPSAAASNTTVVVYSGSKKVKTFKPTAGKTYKFAISGKKIANTKFKAVSKLNGNAAAKTLSTGAVKAKANVWKSTMKASLKDCAALTHGSRIMKVYYSGSKMYADVWFYNTWRYTTQKNLACTVKVTVDGKVVSKKVKVKLAKLAPQKSVWKKKVCLGNNVVDLVNGGQVAVG